VNIKSCIPRLPRLVSDVWNHAYQNRDYSPYSGQQPESISQNLQAACVLKMTTGDRGELGRQLMYKDNRTAFEYSKKLRKKVDNLIKAYESITIQIIEAVGHNMTSLGIMKTKQNKGKYLHIQTNNCFRCAEVGSRTSKRKTTNTYIPSFEIPAKLLHDAAQYVPPAYGHLITIRNDGVGVLQIYNAVVEDMNKDLLEASKTHGLHYQGAKLKTEKMATKSDPSSFMKIVKDEKGVTIGKDKGVAAARLVESERRDHEIPVIADMSKQAMTGRTINELICKGVLVAGLEKITTTIAGTPEDMDGLMMDKDCVDGATKGATPRMKCKYPGSSQMLPGQLFPAEGQVEEILSSSALGMTISWLSAFSLFVGVVFQL